MGASLNRGKSKQDYQTPPNFLLAVQNLLGIKEFTVDLAASDENTVAARYFTEQHSALGEADWITLDGWGWLNPPFGDIKPWVAKAAREAYKGNRIAMLVPAAVGSNWWAEFVGGTADVFLLNGRIQFVGAQWPYPKDCALLLYHPAATGGYRTWRWKDAL